MSTNLPPAAPCLIVPTILPSQRTRANCGPLPGRSPRHRDALRPPGDRGLRRPVDARRQPGQVAPGPYELVLRDRSCSSPAGPATAASRRQYAYLFNSYYNALGERIARSERGLLSRPTVAEVYRYRAAVDEEMHRFLEQAEDDGSVDSAATVVLGLHHEQQHQELILTDLKHLFSRNPLRPVYREQEPTARPMPRHAPLRLGVAGRPGCAESVTRGAALRSTTSGPGTRCIVEAFRLADRLVTNGEYLAFIDGRRLRPARILALRRLERAASPAAGPRPSTGRSRPRAGES